MDTQRLNKTSLSTKVCGLLGHLATCLPHSCPRNPGSLMVQPDCQPRENPRLSSSHRSWQNHHPAPFRPSANSTAVAHWSHPAHISSTQLFAELPVAYRAGDSTRRVWTHWL